MRWQLGVAMAAALLAATMRFPACSLTSAGTGGVGGREGHSSQRRVQLWHGGWVGAGLTLAEFRIE